MRAYHAALRAWGIEPPQPRLYLGRAQRLSRNVRELGWLKVCEGRARLEADDQAVAVIRRRRARLLAEIRRAH